MNWGGEDVLTSKVWVLGLFLFRLITNLFQSHNIELLEFISNQDCALLITLELCHLQQNSIPSLCVPEWTQVPRASLKVRSLPGTTGTQNLPSAVILLNLSM